MRAFWGLASYFGGWRQILLAVAAGAAGGLLYLFAAAVQGTVLGALITLSDRAWYRSHAETALGWGLSAIADQQLAGAIMWVPVGVIYVAAGLALLASYLRAAEGQSA